MVQNFNLICLYYVSGFWAFNIIWESSKLIGDILCPGETIEEIFILLISLYIHNLFAWIFLSKKSWQHNTRTLHNSTYWSVLLTISNPLIGQTGQEKLCNWSLKHSTGLWLVKSKGWSLVWDNGVHQSWQSPSQPRSSVTIVSTRNKSQQLLSQRVWIKKTNVSCNSSSISHNVCFTCTLFH